MKVLVALDGSPLSERVLGVLGWLSEVADAEVLLVRVVDEDHIHAQLRGQGVSLSGATWRITGSYNAEGVFMPTPGLRPGDAGYLEPRYAESASQAEQHATDEAQSYLRGAANQLRGVHIHTLVRVSGDVPGAIVDLAKEQEVAFIAMATHGRTGLARTFRGSIAEDVLRRSEVPVLLHRATA